MSFGAEDSGRGPLIRPVRGGSRERNALYLRPMVVWWWNAVLGAHHGCWLLLQTLFMNARMLPVASNTVTTTIRDIFMRLAYGRGTAPFQGAARGRREAAMASLQHPERMRTRADRSCYGEPKSCTESPRYHAQCSQQPKGRCFRRGCERRSPRPRRACCGARRPRVEDGRPDPGRGTCMRPLGGRLAGSLSQEPQQGPRPSVRRRPP